MKQMSYSDIALIPQKCIVDSRKECDTSVFFGEHTFDMPVFPSNMKSVIDEETCIFLAKNKWFYIMHRFGISSREFAEKMKELNLFISISTGVNEDSYKDLTDLSYAHIEPDYITIDVANAWSNKCEKMVKFIKEKFPDTFLIVGNVATNCAIDEINKWGVSAIKVGIAGGSVCVTKNKTGINRPMVSTIMECHASTNLPIIADGGIVYHGDIAKALVCGASMVMAGSLFAGYDQSAGNIIEIEDSSGNISMYKEYYGSASKYNKSEIKNIEGKKVLVKFKGDMKRLLVELKEDLQSSISYLGCRKVKEMKDNLFYTV